MEYERLSPEQRQEMLDQRILALEQEHYHHELNKLANQELARSGAKERRELAKENIRQADTAQRELEALLDALRGKSRRRTTKRSS